MRTVQEQWEDYKEKVLPKDAPAIQVSECRLAFYAGVVSFKHVMQEIAYAGLSDTAEMAVLMGIEEELREFSRGVAENEEPPSL